MKHINQELASAAISQRADEYIGCNFNDLSDKDRLALTRDVFGYMIERGTLGEQEDCKELFTEALGEAVGAAVHGCINPFDTYALLAVNEYVLKVLSPIIEPALNNATRISQDEWDAS